MLSCCPAPARVHPNFNSGCTRQDTETGYTPFSIFNGHLGNTTGVSTGQPPSYRTSPLKNEIQHKEDDCLSPNGTRRGPVRPAIRSAAVMPGGQKDCWRNYPGEAFWNTHYVLHHGNPSTSERDRKGRRQHCRKMFISLDRQEDVPRSSRCGTWGLWRLAHAWDRRCIGSGGS